MKIKLYGTGALVTSRFSACALIDDKILFDCPNGLVKKLRQDDAIDKIEIVIISHYHADHDYDLAFLLWEYNRSKRQNQLNIIAPKGFFDRYKVLCDMAWPGLFTWNALCKNVSMKIIEAADKKIINLCGYKIQAFKVDHANADAYAYGIEKDGKTIAFTGDSAMCENINLLVSNANIAFVDVTGYTPAGVKPLHFDPPQFIELQKSHKNVRFVPVHMNESTADDLKEKGINPPNDGDIFVI